LDSAEEFLTITPDLHIPLSELRFRFARSRGPGGQHVQKVETQVELLFDIARSPSLSEEQRARLQEKLAGYIDREGTLHLVSRESRSQLRNRQRVTARFQALLRHALQVPKRRHPTQPSAAAREQRLRHKKRRGEIKRERRPPLED
jgi:ribosome-associated protein